MYFIEKNKELLDKEWKVYKYSIMPEKLSTNGLNKKF
jgi:hypothetical protein